METKIIITITSDEPLTDFGKRFIKDEIKEKMDYCKEFLNSTIRPNITNVKTKITI